MILQKVKVGCVFWTKFELFLKKICRLLTINPCTMRMVVKNFIMYFNNINNPLFLIERKRKHFNTKCGRAKIPSPGPPSFLPSCFNHPSKNRNTRRASVVLRIILFLQYFYIISSNVHLTYLISAHT